MFKIDKTSVEYIDSNKSAVVIRYWSPQDNRFDGSSVSEQVGPDEKKAIPADDKKPNLNDPLMEDPQKIIEQAYKEADAIKAAAWQEGFHEAIDKANEQLELILKQYKEKFDQAMTDLQGFQEDVIAELEDSVLQLSFDIAEKIINIQLEKDDILFIGIVKKAIERLNAKEKFTIRLNEIQFDKYFSVGPDWLMEEIQCAPFTPVKDSSVRPYGCVLESDEGIIDAGVKNQIKMLKRTFDKEDKQYDEAL